MGMTGDGFLGIRNWAQRKPDARDKSGKPVRDEESVTYNAVIEMPLLVIWIRVFPILPIGLKGKSRGVDLIKPNVRQLLVTGRSRSET